jgi:hypothetical protein
LKNVDKKKDIIIEEEVSFPFPNILVSDSASSSRSLSKQKEIDEKASVEENIIKNTAMTTTADVLKWCYENGYGHIETSAKDGSGVETAMLTLASLAYELQKSATWIDSTPVVTNRVNLNELYSPNKKKGFCCL